MVSARKVVLYGSTALLCLLFSFAGVTKLSPVLSRDMHGEMKSNFNQFVRVPPIDLIKLEADVYRTIVAVVELLCVACLLCPDSGVQLFGNYILLAMMLGALYTHFMVGDGMDKTSAAILGLVLVLTRLYVSGRLVVKLKTK